MWMKWLISIWPHMHGYWIQNNCNCSHHDLCNIFILLWFFQLRWFVVKPVSTQPGFKTSFSRKYFNIDKKSVDRLTTFWDYIFNFGCTLFFRIQVPNFLEKIEVFWLNHIFKIETSSRPTGIVVSTLQDRANIAVSVLFWWVGWVEMMPGAMCKNQHDRK